MENFGKIIKIIVGILIIAAIAIIILWQTGILDYLFGSGSGNGEGSGDSEVVSVVATVQEQSTETTVTTQEIEYIEICVSGNAYNYNNKTYEVEELESLSDEILSALSEETKSVRITDDNASGKAYSELVSMLEDNNIQYIEVSE